MPPSPARRPDFSTAHSLALAMAGTVRIPATPPAVGDLYLVPNPDDDDGPGGAPPYLLKFVQVIDALHEVTRFIAIEDLKAISLPEEGKAPGEAPLKAFPARKITQSLKTATTSLTKSVKAGGVEESLLYQGVVLHVRESAPVLVRMLSHYSVTAAEAATSVALAAPPPCNGNS